MNIDSDAKIKEIYRHQHEKIENIYGDWVFYCFHFTVKNSSSFIQLSSYFDEIMVL